MATFFSQISEVQKPELKRTVKTFEMEAAKWRTVPRKRLNLAFVQSGSDVDYVYIQLHPS